MFIATTQGLVKVEYLAALEVSERSTVLLSDNSKKSRIADDYHNFVQSNTGIINRIFNAPNAVSKQFRLTLSAEIDHGQSWHLAVFISHLLFAHQRLAMGDVQPGDEIILATGEINVSTHAIGQINHLAQKCFRARHQISQAYADCQLMCFFVPGANYRQPLPDINMVLTPLDHLPQLISFFSRMGIGDHDGMTSAQQLPVSLSNNEGEEILAVKEKKHGFWFLLITTCVVFTVFAFFYFFSVSPKMYEKRVGLNGCIDTDETQYELSLDQNLELPTTYMHGLCSLEFTMPSVYKSAFIVSENGFFSQLERTKRKRWVLPLPQDKTQPRRYYIVFATRRLDEADIQTLNAIVSNALVHNTVSQAKFNVSIVNWASSNDTEIYTLKHRLH